MSGNSQSINLIGVCENQHRCNTSDLIAVHGDKYRRYWEQVPMIIPALNASVQLEQETATKAMPA